MSKTFIIFILFFNLSMSEVFSQTPMINAFRNDSLGAIQIRRQSTFDGNLVRSIFYNNGEIAQWPFQPSAEWPKGTGHSYLDGFSLLISSEIITPGNNQVNHPLQTSYREWMDTDPITGIKWGFEPIPGYCNPTSLKFASSVNPDTWPVKWPSALNLDSSWNGHWFGYFGKDVFYPSFESYFVMDDSKDGEWKRGPYYFYPILGNENRGGLGLRVENRLLQWSGRTIENVLFSLYNIYNISDYTYSKSFFGFYIDLAIGGPNDAEDDMANGSKQIDLVYMFDYDAQGVPNNWETGYIGCALLQTPSNAVNNIDDDSDGMIDERQDDGIDNDEDWFVEIDDVGADGIAGTNDSGEGDGIPTQGEPNFDRTDIHEADQIGLTALSVYRLGQGGTGGGWPKDDEAMWLKMSTGIFDLSLQRSNISLVMSSGSFPLKKWGNERFVSALIFANTLDSLMYHKFFTQKFFESNFDQNLITSLNHNLVENLSDFSLSNNYPNPFNPTTEIQYELKNSANIVLSIFDLNGNKIKNIVDAFQLAGVHKVKFNAQNLASGTYFYTLQIGNKVLSKKMIFLK